MKPGLVLRYPCAFSNSWVRLLEHFTLTTKKLLTNDSKVRVQALTQEAATVHAAVAVAALPRAYTSSLIHPRTTLQFAPLKVTHSGKKALLRTVVLNVCKVLGASEEKPKLKKEMPCVGGGLSMPSSL